MGLDFIVIGAQKAGTTSLWQYLRRHPDLWLPGSKEEPFFTAPRVSEPALRAFMDERFGSAPEGALLGKVTPDYMVGRGDVAVERVAERIAEMLPGVKLIALLRDPVERALSSYTMAVRRREETRSADQAIQDLLATGVGEAGAARIDPTNSYVSAGEYGRMLAAYRDRVPVERLLVAYAEELAADPGALLDRVLAHLGLPPGFRPNGLGARHFEGGRETLLSADAAHRLFEFFEEDVAPHMRGDLEAHRRAFAFFFRTWNVAPDRGLPALSAEVRGVLEDRFRADAERLADLGLSAPWIERWDGGCSTSATT